MKKTIVTAAVLLTALLFASCKKEYSCECTYSVMGIQGGPKEQHTIKASKRKAEKTCSEKNSSVSGMGVTLDKRCYLL